MALELSEYFRDSRGHGEAVREGESNVSDEQFYKTIVLRGAWEKAGLRESLPPPDVIDSQVCYMRDIAFARKVLALLKEHAGDLEVDRSIGTIERSLALRGEQNHG